MKKRWFGIFGAVLSLVLLFAFAACGPTEKPPITPEKFTVTVENGTGGGSFEKDSDCTVTANSTGGGSLFTEWTVGGKSVSTKNPYTFKVKENVTIKANFKNVYTVTVTGGKIDGKTSVTVNDGASVTAKTDTVPNKRFIGWYNGETLLSASADYTFTVTSQITITAKYVDTFTVTVTGGKIDGKTTAVVDAGAEVTVVFDAGANKVFEKWTVDGTSVSTDEQYTFSVTKNVEVVAVYTQKIVTPKNDANQMFTKKASGYSDMIVEIDRQKNTEGGKITAFTEGVDYVMYYVYTSTDADKNNYVGQFKLVQTVANANAELQLLESVAGVKNISVGSTPGDYYFDRVSNADFFGFIAAAVGEDYDALQSYYLAAQSVAVADTAYRNSDISEIGTSVIQEKVAGTVNVVGGTGGGRFEVGSECTVTATVEEGYYFVKWTVDGKSVSTEKTYKFTVGGDITLTAVTELIPEEQFTIEVTNGTGGGSFIAGARVTVTPTVPENKGFVCWKDGAGTEVSTSYNYTFIVTESVTLTAEFGDLIAVETPKNDANQMFKYIGWGDHRNTTEFDRQKNEDDTNKTALVTGVDYLLYHIYASDKTTEVGTFKLVKDSAGNGKITTMDGSLSIGCGSEPGNYFIDNTNKATYFGFFAAAIGEEYDKFEQYYFAVQAIAIENSIYTDSGISEVGTSGIRQANPIAVNVENGTGGGNFETGDICTVTATVAEGDYFIRWTVNGEEVSREISYTFTVTEAVTVTAVTSAIPAEKFTVTVTNGTGGGSFVAGTVISVNPEIPEGKGFICWKIDGKEVSRKASYTFNVIENVTLTAEFGEVKTVVTPKNDTNQMFTKKASGYSDMIVEIDRQRDGETKVSAFTDGVDYILFHLYTSTDADKSASVGTFKLIKDSAGNGKITTMDGSLSIGCGSEPGNYFFDRVLNADFFALIAAAVGDDYSADQEYFVAAQAIAFTEAVGDTVYEDSSISEIGTSVIKQAI